MRKLLLVAALAAGMMGTAMAEVDKDEVINYRQSLFSVIGWNMGTLGGMAKGDIPFDAEKATEAARLLHEAAKATNSTMIDGTFEGSNAKPKIADNREDFEKIMAGLVAESEKMITEAESLDTLRPQMGKLGATCKSCHEEYKLD